MDNLHVRPNFILYPLLDRQYGTRLAVHTASSWRSPLSIGGVELGECSILVVFAEG